MKTKYLELTECKRAIIMFGPPTEHSGKRPAEYYQVTLDPNMLSPSGRYLRFDQLIQGGELHGWQSIDGITVCEVLGPADKYPNEPEGYAIDPNAVLAIAEIDYDSD